MPPLLAVKVGRTRRLGHPIPATNIVICCRQRLTVYMHLSIEPLNGVKGLPLGSSKATVRSFFSGELKVFRRSPTSVPADYWPDLGVFAYYKADSALEALEFTSPAILELGGASLFPISMEVALRFLRQTDPNVKVEIDSAISNALGISIWTAIGKEADSQVETLLLFGAGYYG